MTGEPLHIVFSAFLFEYTKRFLPDSFQMFLELETKTSQ